MSDRTIHIEQYYTALPHIEKRFDKYARQKALRADSYEEYIEWRTSAREELSNILGMDKMETSPLDPNVSERVVLDDGIIREKVIIQVEPDVYMPVYILIPKSDGTDRLKCIICPHGHSGAGKYSVAGRRDIPAVRDKIEFFNYDYGMQLAKKGYVTLCPDCRGFGERRELALQSDEEKDFINSTCFQLAHMAEPLGMSVIGMCVWDLMRLTDYIIMRDEWATDNIACVGFSGGGMQTLYFAALDERVKASAISGYMYGVKESLLERNGNCSCNYVRGLWEAFDMGDIGAMIAPRPVLIQSARDDHLNGRRGIINAIEQVDIMRKAYTVTHSDDKLIHKIIEGGHHYDSDIDELLRLI